jgi:hypothetical protein
MVIYGIDYAPVIRYGVPDKRDGLADYEMFWNEQIDRLHNGYTTPHGKWIPGNYYMYLNFGTIMGLPDGNSARKVPMRPIYRDGDEEFFMHLHYCRTGFGPEKKKKGAIIPKGRRRGYSWMVDHVALHEFMLYPNVQIGVGSQGDTDKGYVKEFREKFNIAWAGLPVELRPSLNLEDNKYMLKSGYKEKVDGEILELGLGSIINWANFQNPGIWRGLSLGIGIWEEAGQIQNLKKSYLASLDCFKEGDYMFGLPIIGGTSNKIQFDNTDFQEMCCNPDDYNLAVLFMDATKCYYPMYDPATGISDVEGAKRIHEQNLAKLSSSADGGDSQNKMSYWSYRQEWPQVWTDLWLIFGGGTFPLDLINDQIAHLTMNEELNTGEWGELDWPKDAKGIEQMGQMPIWRKSSEGKLFKTHDPIPNLIHAYCGAYDPYFLDDELNGQSQTDSKACVMAYRRFISPSVEGEVPAMYYHDRPYMKETVYEYAWKMAIYYDMSILAEAGDDEFLRYFMAHGAVRRLQARPTSAEAPWGAATNRFGIHMKEYQKRLGESLGDSHLKRHIGKIRMIALLKELAVYKIQNTDIAMTYLMCLIHDYDIGHFLVREREDEEGLSADLQLPTYSEQGGLIVSNLAASTRDRDTNTSSGERDPYDYGY